MKWSDLPWLLLFLGAGGAFAWLLYQHWNGPLSPGSRESIGTIVEKTLNVQRQFSESTLWRPMQNGTDVYAFDKIRTTQGSQATIILKDGTQFTLQEQSLIVLSWEEGRPALIVDEGMLRVSSQSQMEVRLGEQVVVIPQGTAQLSRTQDNVNIVPEEGTIRVRNGGEELNFDPGTLVNVNQGVVSREENAWTFVQPRPEDVFYLFNDTGMLRFQGRPMNGYTVSGSLLESATGVRTPLSQDGTTLLEPGAWKWLVLLEREGVQKEVAAPFQVVSVPLTVPLSPPDGSEFRYVTAAPPVLLAWSPAGEVSQFRVLISENPDLSVPVVNRLVNSQAFTAVGLSEGEWYWGVFPVYPERTIDQASPIVQRFNLVTVSRSFAPRILRPLPEESFSESAIGSTGVSFQWQVPVEGVSTEVTLYADAAKSRVAASGLGTTALNLRAELPPGSYPFVLRTVFGPGDFSNKTEGTLTVRPRAALPVWLGPESKTRQPWVSGSKALFRWDKGGTYRVVLQYSQDQSWNVFESLGVTSDNELEFLPNVSGTWYFRLRGLSEDGQFVGYSETLEVTFLPPPRSPVFIAPAENLQVSVQDAVPLSARWALDGSGQVVWTLTGPSGEISRGEGADLVSALVEPEIWPEGLYVWKVEFTYDSEKPALTSERPFTVVRVQRLSAVTGLRPVGSLALSLDGEDSITFQWSVVPGARYYEFQLRDAGGRILENRQGLRSNTLIVDIGLLAEEGQYQWQVRAVRVREDAEDLGPWAIGRLQVALPELLAPETTSPDVIYVE